MTDGQVLPTLAPGQTVTVSKQGDTVRIVPPAGEAFAAAIVPGGSNVETSNGILQKIDRVRGRGGAEAARCRILNFNSACADKPRPPASCRRSCSSRPRPRRLEAAPPADRGRALVTRAAVQCLCPAFASRR
jgi:hypothetical protein